MDVEILSRIQFAFTVSFHYIYPPLSIGIGLMLVISEGLFLKTKDQRYEVLTRFWVKIFALTFGIGVATGIVMEFEFGTNWATYSRYVGDIFGSALAAEGIFAFALESSFLGILLFGWNKVSPKVHFMSTVGVFFGSMFSAIWIVVANSWQQTPAGYKIVGEGMEARAEITDFWEMVFNPSSVERILHVWVGAFLAGAFLFISVHAYYLVRDRHQDISKLGIKLGLIAATVFSFVQLFLGHMSADGVAVNQPAKLAAFEGHYYTDHSADLYLFGWVDQESKEVYGVKVPGGLAFLTQFDFDGKVDGLDAFPEDEIPTQINAVFQFYHLMVGIGMMLIGLSVLGTFYWIRGKLFEQKWLLWVFVFAVILPQLANQFGWFAAEMGRQPWVVYGLLRTSDALSKAVQADQVLFSLIMFTFVYTLLFILFIYLLNKKIKHGPSDTHLIDHRPHQQGINDFFSE
ncbi:cytochrome ubiquinol oxidase subunit I [Flammeovirga aprica]|uniref:Cytochrome ubiquinol oxidase subunit I n=1 Tax=Flammeovirga aprica JL-4 TaxID=694437 RepID=A0A7X9P1E1_9BACT|nr:cytochrome ubiquinol oxidase subunit I [Flammeovirga aprica]NME67761.1 cytochrome ubiquinol oxidase subunit I [Flammeovirga aprica JL-4]